MMDLMDDTQGGKLDDTKDGGDMHAAARVTDVAGVRPAVWVVTAGVGSGLQLRSDPDGAAVLRRKKGLTSRALLKGMHGPYVPVYCYARVGRDAHVY